MTTFEVRERLLTQFPGSRLERVSATVEARIREEYSWLPDDYFAFLREVGWGGIGESRYMIYSGPIEPDELFDRKTADSLEGVILVGDDFGECFEAYAKRGDRCVFGCVSKEDGRFEPHSETRLMDFFVSWFGER